MTLAQYQELADPDVRKIWDSSMKRPKQVVPQLFMVDTTDKLTENDIGFGGFGMAEEIPEGGDIPTDDPAQGYDVSYTQRWFGKGFTVTKKMYKFDRYGEIRKLPRKNAFTLTRKVEYDGASIFNNAFSGGIVGGDGQQLISTAHPLHDSPGDTNNNRIQLLAAAGGTVNPDLDIDALDGARYQASQQLDDKGELAPATFDTIVYGPGLAGTVWTKLHTEKVTGSNNNDRNQWFNKLKEIEVPYITSSSAWFLIDSETNPLVWLWSQKPQLYDMEVVYKSKNCNYNADMFYDFGFSTYFGIWGSKGTNAS